MIKIECNGIVVEAETEKEARKELRKLVKAQEAERVKESERYHHAKQKAESGAYRVLSRFMSGDEFPRGWTFYAPSDDWARHLFNPLRNDTGGRLRAHKLNTQYGELTLDHYGNDLMGAVCNGSGFCWIVFLRDTNNGATACYAVGGHEGHLALAECPSIKPEQFRNSKQEQTDDAEASLAVAV